MQLPFSQGKRRCGTGLVMKSRWIVKRRLIWWYPFRLAAPLNLPPLPSMRFFTLFLVVLTCSSCARIAELKEVKPVFEVKPGLTATFPSHAQAFARATKLEQKQPLLAGELYLGALQELAAQLDRTPADLELRRTYNYALDRVFSLIRAHNFNPWDAPLKVGRFTVTHKRVPRARWHPSIFEFLPTDQVKVEGEYLKYKATRDGLGSSLVAIGRTPKKNARATFSQEKTYYGISAVTSFKGDQCEVSFHDPLDEETVKVGRHTYPLIAEFTTPLAVLLTRERPERLGLVRLLDPDKYAETARLSRLRPYSDDRIPLLLVHGLLDTPATWVPMVNALRTDPVLREKYQIWVYSYPSGYPYPYSAALLRKELDRVREVFPKHKPIVYIGHSMGGMIGRLMLTDSGDKIWNAYFHEPVENVGMPTREKKLMKDMLIFQSRPDISRAIFICSPHRGAKLAGNWVGKIGRRLVRVPQTMLEIGDAISKVVTFSESGLAYESLPTSIDTLTETNTFVKTVGSLPLSPRIPYHSIIGDRGKSDAKRDPAKGSDSFVDYTSSHLAGAASELIIPSDHSGHQHPDGISEVIRILHLHLKGGKARVPQSSTPALGVVEPITR
jgi:pimeloyl-ACP methyl ester carboxylesterase